MRGSLPFLSIIPSYYGTQVTLLHHPPAAQASRPGDVEADRLLLRSRRCHRLGCRRWLRQPDGGLRHIGASEYL